MGGANLTYKVHYQWFRKRKCETCDEKLHFEKMWRITLSFLVGVCVWGVVLCIKCPDGRDCSDMETCCPAEQGYSCCPYPNAVCCSDLAHCCPSGFICNLTEKLCEKQSKPWMNIPMVKKEVREEPSTPVLPTLQDLGDSPAEQTSLIVHCDNYHVCPDGTTCCRHPNFSWYCCPYSPGTCCVDGFHCCPYGYNCDISFTFCVRQQLRYPFTARHPLTSVPAALILASVEKRHLQETPLTSLSETSGNIAEAGIIRCDSKVYCPEKMSCCRGPQGQWSCCPFQLGQCCADGQHCCEHGYTCGGSSKSCQKLFRYP